MEYIAQAVALMYVIGRLQDHLMQIVSGQNLTIAGQTNYWQYKLKSYREPWLYVATINYGLSMFMLHTRLISTLSTSSYWNAVAGYVVQ